MARVTCTGMDWRDLLSNLQDRDVLFIAPSVQKEDMVRRELGDVLSRVSVVTLDGLAREIADSAAPGIRRISMDTTEFVVRSVLEDLRRDLRYLPDVRVFRGTAAAVTRALVQMINSQPEIVRQGFAAAFDQGELSPRERDLILVGDEFLRRMGSKEVACDDLLKTTALEALESDKPECERVASLRDICLVFDGVYLGAELYWRLLKALAGAASRSYVLRRALPPELDGEASIERIRTSLLQSRFEDRLALEMSGRWIDRFDTREQEVRGVAARIAKLLSDHPELHPSEIGVIAPSLDRYQALVEEYFSAYGVPIDFPSGFPLRASPTASIARALLSQAQTPGERAGLFRLLASGLVEADRIDVQTLDRLARRFNVSNLSELAEVLDKMPQEYLPEGDERTSLEQSLNGLQSLLDDLRVLGSETNPRALSDALIGAMSKLRVVINAVRVPWLATEESEHGVVRPVSLEFSDEWSRRNARALSAFVDAVGDVRDAWLLFDDGKDPDPEDLVQMIEDVLDERRYRCRPIQEAVRVMSFADARGIDFSYCFVLGLVEGEFPSMPDRGFLLRKRVEWQERRREAAYSLIDLMFGSGHVSLSAFASEGSDRFSISPLFRDHPQAAVEEVASTAQDGDPGTRADFEAQIAAGIALTQDRPDVLTQFLPACGVAPCLDQLRMEVCREDRGRGGPYGGEVQPRLLNLENRRYSVTQLETYIRCPFLYMARYILGVEPLEEVDDELESSEMGSLIHYVLSEFGRRDGFKLVRSDVAATRKLLLQITQDAFGTAAAAGRAGLFVQVQYERLVDGLEPGELEQHGLENDGVEQGEPEQVGIDQHGPEQDELERDRLGQDQPGQDGLNRKTRGLGLLRRFLDFEAARESSVVPELFEQDFELDLPLPGCQGPGCGVPIKIIGKIDRVDISEDGSLCLVIDYKTGGLPAISDIEKGLSLQLPVYLMALERQKHTRNAVARLSGYCHLPSAGPVKFGAVFGDLGSLPEVLNRPARRGDLDLSKAGGLDAIADRILALCQQIRQGQFATTALDEVRAGCRYCEFSRVCRHDRTGGTWTDESAAAEGGS
jgi:ATP-dependent helicase/DNAse subunit B